MSRYSSYSSRYGDKDDDYSSLSSYSRAKPERPRTNYSSTSSRTSTYTPKSYDSSSYLSPSSKSSYSSKYESYSSKYGDSNKHNNKKMEDTQDVVVPIAKDEIEELDYSAPQSQVEAEEPELTDDQQEVLQESQIEDFVEPKSAEATLVLSEETDDADMDVLAKNEDEIRSATPEPISPVNENKTPSPVRIASKTVVGGWPPKVGDGEAKIAANQDTDTVPKKRVSDLIARFNTGNVDVEAKKIETSYKSEYGASNHVGKITQSQFE